MKKLSSYLKIVLCLTISCLVYSGQAQHLENDWVQTFGSKTTGDDRTFGLVNDSQGNIYVSGYFQGELKIDEVLLTTEDVFGSYIAKFNPKGELIWVKNTPFTSEETIHLAIDDTGLYVASTWRKSFSLEKSKGNFLEIPASNAEKGTYLGKFDLETGYNIWSNTFEGNSEGYIAINRLVTFGTALYITGYFKGDILLGVNRQDYFLKSEDKTGSFVSSFDIKTGKKLSVKKIEGERCFSKTLAVNETGVYVSGNFDKKVYFDSRFFLEGESYNNFFLVKYNHKLTKAAWATHIGSESVLLLNDANVDETGVYIVGMYREEPCDFDVGKDPKSMPVLDTYGTGYIAKYDLKDGKNIWVKTFVALDVTKMTINKSGAYAIGEFVGVSDFDFSGSVSIESAKEITGFILKFNAADGKSIWVNGMGGYDRVFPYDVKISNDEVWVTGSFMDEACDFNVMRDKPNIKENEGFHDSFIAKYDTETGDNIWAKSFGTLRGGQNEWIRELIHDTEGNAYVMGLVDGLFSFGDTVIKTSSFENIFLAKYDPEGNLLWMNFIVGEGGNSAVNLVIDNTGIYLSGNFRNSCNFNVKGAPKIISSPNKANFVAKYDIESGENIWVRQNELETLLINYQSRLFLIRKNRDFLNTFLSEINPANGYNLWTKPLGNINTYDISAAIMDESGIYIAAEVSGATTINLKGKNQTYRAEEYRDIILIKYDLQKEYCTWVRMISSDDYESFRDMTLDNTGLYVFGTFRSVCDFNKEGSKPMLKKAISQGNNCNDLFVAKYNLHTGENIWVKQINNLDKTVELSRNMSIDSSGVYVAATLRGTYDFDPDESGEIVKTGKEYNSFVAKYGLEKGDFLYVEQIGGDDGMIDIIELSVLGGQMYAAGLFRGKANFNPKTAKKPLIITNTQNTLFLAKYKLRD